MAGHSHNTGQNPHDKLPAFGYAPGHAANTGQNAYDKLPAFYRRDCDHDQQPGYILDERAPRQGPRVLRPMRFVSLHHHSTYSYLDGFQLPEAHVRRVSELNGSALALTEHGNVASHSKFEQAARKQGIKPIFGCEFYCGEIEEGRANQLKNHLTVVAQNLTGYRNLLKLVTRSYEEGFYYEATVSGQMMREHSDGLIVMSGCNGSLLFTSLVGGKLVRPEDASYARAKRVAARFKNMFGDRYYLEVQAFPELASHCVANPLIARMGRELGIPIVATLDCHYTLPTEREIQQILHTVRGGGKKTLEQLTAEWGYKAELCPVLTDNTLLRQLERTGLSKQDAINAILATEDISSRCEVELPKLPMLRFPLPRGYRDGQQLFRDWLREGWRYRKLDSRTPAEQARYRQRLQYEAEMIESKDFVDYFLVVSDAVKFAKEAGIAVGPARGSAAASLVCWLLRITEVDPMLFPHLVFERFIDVSRQDLPDIDLDFESARRSEVTDYLVTKYGRDCVNNIGTFTTYKSRLALDDVARVYHVPTYEVERIKDVLVERSSGDLRSSATIEDTIEQFEQARTVVEKHPEIYTATRLEGNVKGFGIHAAGVVVSNGPIHDVCSVVERVVNGDVRRVVNVDKYDAEYLGLLKLDFLGLSTMDVLADCCKQLGKPVSFLYDIPIEDDKTIAGFKANDVVGIFQYEGRAVRSVAGSLKPDNFQEVCDITALARPGPLHNGASNEYIDIKRGITEPKVAHPALEPITAQTYYQIVYQEQILRIVREIGNFDWTHAAYIRKIISKKLGEQEFNRQWEKFLEGALTVHERLDVPPMEEELAQKIWGMCITAGAYAFNAAHSVAYGYIAWWTMWFKQHHPEIFYTASLRRVASKNTGSEGRSNVKASGISKAKLDPQVTMLRDAANIGNRFPNRPQLTILPPDLRRSGVTWQRLRGRRLQAGFDQIPGVGVAMSERIIDWRKSKNGTPLTWPQLIEVKGIGQKTLEKYLKFCQDDDPFGIYKLDELLSSVRRLLPNMRIPRPTHTALEVPYDRGPDVEITWMGIAVHRNLRDIFESNRARTGVELKPEEVKNPELNEWMMIVGYDGSELVTLRINRFKYPRFRKIVWGIDLHRDVVVARGVKPGFRTAREIYVNDLWVIDPD